MSRFTPRSHEASQTPKTKGFNPDDFGGKKGSDFFGGNWKPMPKLNTPVKWDNLSHESTDTLDMREVFDGFRFDFMRVFGKSFSTGHSMAMGSVVAPPSYNFSANYASDNGPSMYGRIDTDGNMIGTFITNLSKSVSVMCQGQVAQRSEFAVEVEQKGDDYYGTLKWVTNGTHQVTYTQSITNRLSVGCEGVYLHKQGNAGLSMGLRYATDKSVATAMGSMGALVFSYTQKPSDKVRLSTDLIFQQSPYGLESQWRVGCNYQLTMSAFKAQVDSAQKVSAILQESMNDNTRFSLCAELDHKKKQYTFGIGMAIQI